VIKAWRKCVGVLVLALLVSGTLVAQDGSKREKGNKRLDPVEEADFSEAVANRLLRQLNDGLEGHSQRQFLSAFDADKFEGYLTLEEQMQAYFEKFGSFRSHFRILQTSVEGTRGVAIVEFEVESSPANGNAVQRRSNQLRFEMERGRKGWKIVEMRPRGFFS
jgi:hypothetical protein